MTAFQGDVLGSAQTYPSRQSPFDSHFAMQNERATREPNGPERSSKPQPGTALSKRTHAASSAHPPPPQLSCVQYPPGWDRSQRRSPRIEQSVETWHLSPISGVHAASAASRTTPAPSRARDADAIGSGDSGTEDRVVEEAKVEEEELERGGADRKQRARIPSRETGGADAKADEGRRKTALCL
jgi:hypothetical protein